jgi:hypothetical protein
VASARRDVGLFEATAADHQYHPFAAGALELENRSQHARQQFSTVAAQIADVRLIKLNLLQIRMHAEPFKGWNPSAPEGHQTRRGRLGGTTTTRTTRSARATLLAFAQKAETACRGSCNDNEKDE